MQIIKQKNELEYLEVSNALSSIKIAFQGAHIFDFRVKDKPKLLFLSDTSHFAIGKAIRGGIPICWPWFGAHASDNSLPNHGFARSSLWTHVETEALSESKTKIVFSLESSEESLKMWPYDFELTLEIYMSDILEVSLISKNRGEKSFTLTQALHTYLEIEEIHEVEVQGLRNKPFYNKLDNSFDNVENEELKFTTEVDRIYYDLSQPLFVKDANQNITVETKGSNSVVVWNPGSEYKKSFNDLSAYENMLCLESANVFKDEIELQPNEVHMLKTIISQS